ncbi:MAG TPA: hypothetical protein VNJ53_07640 [Gaiellaceae bacterium]|nr:hypothetical protein [Gaiellaceae bacterium]
MDEPRPAAPPSRLDARELALLAAGACALALAMTWPLALRLGSDVGKDLGDPLLQAWQVAWIGHALLHAPLDLWQANVYWPERDTLAFSDALVGYAPAALAAQAGPVAALAVYNLLVLFSYALAFAGAFLLARELGAGRPGAAVAGAAFAYAPWKLTQNGHLHVLSSGGIPLALFLLVRGYRRRSPATVLAGFAVASWQVTLGFTLGLQLLYLLLVLGAGLALVALARRRLPRPGRRTAAATGAGLALLVLSAAFMARPYLRVLSEHPEARRTVEQVESFSPPLRGYLAAPEQSWLWGDATHRARAPLAAPDEMSLFPGLAIGLLALAGLASGAYPRRLRVGLAAGALVCAVLALGLRDASGLERFLTPYRLLYDLAPGWDGVRTPGRLTVLTSLALALLAGAGAALLARRAGRAGPALAALALFAILAEGLGPLAHPRVPRPPEAVRREAAPHLHLPTEADLTYTYWTTAGFPPTVNGAGGFDPEPYIRLRAQVAGFPDARSVAALRQLGVRTVLFHPDRAAGSSWPDVAARPVAGLPLERAVVDGVVVFRLRPAEGAG